MALMSIDFSRNVHKTYAREMKHRVDQRIQEASIADPANAHFENQRIKIHQSTNIYTS